MTNNCLTTIEAVLATWNQRRWFICSKRYQQPQREPSIAHSMSKNSTNWEQLFTTVNSYSTWIIPVWKPDKATTTPGLQAVQLTDWLFKGRPADRHWRRQNCVGGHTGLWVSLQRLVLRLLFFLLLFFWFLQFSWGTRPKRHLFHLKTPKWTYPEREIHFSSDH